MREKRARKSVRAENSNHRAKLEQEQLEQLEKETKYQERLNQLVKEEEERMREERAQGIRPRGLTMGRRRLRKIIRSRARENRFREARAAIDEKFRQKIEAIEQKGEGYRYRFWRARSYKFTKEQLLTRSRLFQKAKNARLREECGQREASESVIAENSNHEENEEAGDEQTTKPVGLSEQKD